MKKTKPFDTMIENANILFLYLDPKGSVLMANKKVEDVTGKSKDEIISHKWSDVLFNKSSPPIKIQVFQAILDDSMQYNRTNDFEGSILDRENSERMVCWSLSPLNTDNRKVNGLILIGNDVTDLKQHKEVFQKMDETLRNIFSSISEYALYVVNLEGSITYFGMGSETVFGWKKNDIAFKNAGLLHSNDEISENFNAILKKVQEYGRYETETYMNKKDGSIFPVILTATQFRDTEGKLVGYIFIAKDITELKRLEYQVFQAEKMAAIGQLAAGMAHEINNPLMVIAGRVEMLLDNKKLSPKLREILRIVFTQTDRMRKLVDRFLTFARKRPLEMEFLSINEVIKDIAPLLSYHKMPISKIEIIKNLAKKLPKVKADLHQLQEVFLNLTINACQAMPEGGKLTLKTVSLEDKFVEIRISDTGAGIAPQNLKNLFMPFFSTKKDGTGLGLSICYNIIKSHNGSIDVDTELNKGTTFIIKLPVAVQ
jgi:PAS domain S-box-containing protein